MDVELTQAPRPGRARFSVRYPCTMMAATLTHHVITDYSGTLDDINAVFSGNVPNNVATGGQSPQVISSASSPPLPLATVSSSPPPSPVVVVSPPPPPLVVVASPPPPSASTGQCAAGTFVYAVNGGAPSAPQAATSANLQTVITANPPSLSSKDANGVNMKFVDINVPVIAGAPAYPSGFTYGWTYSINTAPFSVTFITGNSYFNTGPYITLLSQQASSLPFIAKIVETSPGTFTAGGMCGDSGAGPNSCATFNAAIVCAAILEYGQSTFVYTTTVTFGCGSPYAHSTNVGCAWTTAITNPAFCVTPPSLQPVLAITVCAGTTVSNAALVVQPLAAVSIACSSVTSAPSCVLDGGNAHRILTVGPVANVSLSGLSLQNGYTAGTRGAHANSNSGLLLHLVFPQSTSRVLTRTQVLHQRRTRKEAAPRTWAPVQRLRPTAISSSTTQKPSLWGAALL